MKNPLPIAGRQLPPEQQDAMVIPWQTANSGGFTMIEMVTVVGLLSLIVLALMAVFNSTQAAFRASVTQSDVLESGRATMELMANDFRGMSPSYGQSNIYTGAVNFYAAPTNYVSPPSPLVQSLTGGSSQLTNLLENIFILSLGNSNGVPTWYGIGYAVTTNASPGPLYSLYRYSTSCTVQSGNQAWLFTNNFAYFLTVITNGSHLMDGVVSLTVRPYDINGIWMTNNVVYLPGQAVNGPGVTNQNVLYYNYNLTPYYTSIPQAAGQYGYVMYSNTVPASVEIDLGVLEDRSLQRAQSLELNTTSLANYLAGSAGQVHIFRQRVNIPNVVPSAYQ